MSGWNFVLSWVKHEKSFISSVPGDKIVIHSLTVLFILILYIPVHNFSVVLGLVVLDWTDIKHMITCLTQRHTVKGSIPQPLILLIHQHMLLKEVFVYIR